jgi:hypothetical protein
MAFLHILRVWKNMKNNRQVVLHCLREHQLYTKFSKCEFWINEVLFLGHVISPEVIMVDPSKVRDVLDWKPPMSVHQV